MYAYSLVCSLYIALYIIKNPNQNISSIEIIIEIDEIEILIIEKKEKKEEKRKKKKR